MTKKKSTSDKKPKVYLEPDAATLELMEDAFTLNQMLAKEVKEADYDPAFHIAARYEKVREELAQLVAVNNADGFEGGDLKLTSTLSPGRTNINRDKLIEALLAVGHTPDDIAVIIEASEKTGDPFYTVSIKRVTDKNGD